MKSIFFSIILCVSTQATTPCFDCNQAAQQRPPNIDALKQQVRHYFQDGMYEKDVACVATKARNYLLTQLPATPQKAVIFDIDETLLSNYESFKETDFVFNPVVHRSFKEKPIKPMLHLYNFTKNAGFTIFLITGRKKDMAEDTCTNLHEAGFSNWKKIYFRPADDRKSSVKYYKTEARKEIEAQGYTIVANIGDQNSDLRGGYAHKTFKVPNPMYLIP